MKMFQKRKLEFNFSSSSSKRESDRVKDSNHRKILDDAARNRRIKKQLEVLEADNHTTDPHANLVMHKKAPKFEETLEHKRRKKFKSEPYKQRFRKNFAALLEEDCIAKSKVNYITAEVPPSKEPDRHLCSVCGYKSSYNCVNCGSRYCCVKCYHTHQDTRCCKWIS